MYSTQLNQSTQSFTILNNIHYIQPFHYNTTSDTYLALASLTNPILLNISLPRHHISYELSFQKISASLTLSAKENPIISLLYPDSLKSVTYLSPYRT